MSEHFLPLLNIWGNNLGGNKICTCGRCVCTAQCRTVERAVNVTLIHNKFLPFSPNLNCTQNVSSQPLKAHLNQEITLALSFTEPHHKHGQRWRLYYENISLISLIKLLFLCSKVYLHTLTIYMGCLEIAEMRQLEEQRLVWWPILYWSVLSSSLSSFSIVQSTIVSASDMSNANKEVFHL